MRCRRSWLMRPRRLPGPLRSPPRPRGSRLRAGRCRRSHARRRETRPRRRGRAGWAPTVAAGHPKPSRACVAGISRHFSLRRRSVTGPRVVVWLAPSRFRARSPRRLVIRRALILPERDARCSSGHALLHAAELHELGADAISLLVRTNRRSDRRPARAQRLHRHRRPGRRQRRRRVHLAIPLPRSRRSASGPQHRGCRFYVLRFSVRNRADQGIG